jgi:DNA repair protein RadA/Sms
VNKTKTVFICQNCGASSPKWLGKCSHCDSWNSFEEQLIETNAGRKIIADTTISSQPVALTSIKDVKHQRLFTKIDEFNRVVGGGLMPGSVILIGGEPGIGKSTLLLQLALLNKDWKTLYVAGEESEYQIKDRAIRLGGVHDNCLITNIMVVEELCLLFQNIKPDIVIIDSIQTIRSQNLESIPGTISQIRESSYQLINTAKYLNIPMFLVGHITKVGSIAGPKVLEHLVDTVLQFEGEQSNGLRILRTTKNRFGNTSEIGIFEMQQTGLIEVSNPSEVLIDTHSEILPGVALALVNEGIRPLVIEVQSLVSAASFGMPQRSANGYDHKRLNMLLAVLEKRAGLKLSARDVFVNITGGIKITDTAADLAVAAAIISSFLDIVTASDTCFTGEIGLSGEIRPVRQINNRIEEARRLGFKNIISAPVKTAPKTPVIPITEVKELVKYLTKL